MVVSEAFVVSAVAQTVPTVEKAVVLVVTTVHFLDVVVDMLGSFAHFVGTAQAVAGTVVVGVAVPIEDRMVVLVVVATGDTDLRSLAVNTGRWGCLNRVDSSQEVP